MKKFLILAAFLPLAACATVARDGGGLRTLPKVATVDDRYQSYNVEMVEITGGRFWAPYGGPAGEMFRMRPPTDLTNPKLRALAKHLGPAYIRVSGTWANSSYLPNEGEKLTAPPAGFNQLLTREQWRGVVEFAKHVDAKIVTSFPASPGARDTDGSWNPEQAQRLVDLTRETGGAIHGAELFNEPTLPKHGAFPAGYGAKEYARDFGIFRAWARKNVPDMKLTGPGGTAEGTMLKHTAETEARGYLQSEQLLSGSAGGFDIVSYHYYGSVSQRCGSPPSLKDQALTADWLDRTAIDADFYGALRDRHAPGKPLWLNETAQAACGGSAWASTFLDSFRYLNQLGILAQKGVSVVAHNTLAASDYGIIDQDSYAPRPNYWAAVLWKRVMGNIVLASPPSPSPDLRLFAHCLSGERRGVGILAINTGANRQTVSVGGKGRVWLTTGDPVDTRDIRVNGQTPSLANDGSLSGLDGVPHDGQVELPAQSIALLAVSPVSNPACM